jgi:hypothetical protein
MVERRRRVRAPLASWLGEMEAIAASDAGRMFKEDLRALGLRTSAGEFRDRGGHDLRAWFITSCQEHGAHRDLLRVVTHAAKGDIVSGYTRATWAALCAEVAKLKVSILDGKLLELATHLATSERKSRNRRTNVVGVVGIEAVPGTSTIRTDPPVTDGDTTSGQDVHGSSRTRTVASLATALADAVLASDHERARALAEELRELQARPTAQRLRRAK